MKGFYFWLFLLFLVHSHVHAQTDFITTDIDGDKIADTVQLTESGLLICALSGHNFSRMLSKKINNRDIVSMDETRGGFVIGFTGNRCFDEYQFRYDIAAKKMRLIGVEIAYFGKAAGDGEYTYSANLLTNISEYRSSHYDAKKGKLVKDPFRKSKLEPTPIYLESFDGENAVRDEKRTSR